MEKAKGTTIGIAAVLSLVSAGYWLRIESTTGILGSFTPLFVSLFIGTLVGHYIGKSIIQNGEIRQWVIFGIALAATCWWIYSVKVSALTAVLLLTAFSLILSHDTGLIHEDNRIEKAIDGFAENVSPAGLLIYVFIKLGLPYLPELTLSIGQDEVNAVLVIVMLVILAVIFAFGIALVKKFEQILGVDEKRKYSRRKDN